MSKIETYPGETVTLSAKCAQRLLHYAVQGRALMTSDRELVEEAERAIRDLDMRRNPWREPWEIDEAVGAVLDCDGGHVMDNSRFWCLIRCAPQLLRLLIEGQLHDENKNPNQSGVRGYRHRRAEFIQSLQIEVDNG